MQANPIAALEVKPECFVIGAFTQTQLDIPLERVGELASTAREHLASDKAGRGEGSKAEADQNAADNSGLSRRILAA